MTFKECLTKLEGILELEDGWDGSGARKIDTDVYMLANRFLNHIAELHFSPPDRVVPSPDGVILFAWQTARDYREAEITDDGHTIEWMRKDENGKVHHWSTRI